MSKRCDICVVGGGPAGLAASIALAQRRFQVTVVDCAAPPIDKACGEGLMPDCLNALRELGVDLPQHTGFAFKGIRFTDGTSSVVADFPNGTGLGMRRTVLHELLVEHAARLGVSLVWNAKAVQLATGGVSIEGRLLQAGFVVGADGQNSGVRRQAGLTQTCREVRRYGFRRHYRVVPWSSYVEVHWGERCQIYITPSAADQVCVALISRDPQLRLDPALIGFPEIRERLGKAAPVSPERGALSVSRTLPHVSTRGLALIGDASGSIDAISGEGIGLSFRQALSLAASLESGHLERYETLHRCAMRRLQCMCSLMLAFDRHPKLQRRALAALARRPDVFASLLAFHVGQTDVARTFPRRLWNFASAFVTA